MKNKNTVEIIKRFITASLVTFGVYLLTATVLYALFENVGEYVIFVVSLIYSAVFSYFCIYYMYVRDGSGVNAVFSEYKDKSFSIVKDVPVMLRHEWKIIAVFWGINIFSWLLINGEKLLFGKRVLSVLLIFFAPIQFIGETLPSWGGNILGFLVGALIVSVIYLVMILFFRKHWIK